MSGQIPGVLALQPAPVARGVQIIALRAHPFVDAVT